MRTNPQATRSPKICYLGLSRMPDGPGDPRIFQKQLTTLVNLGYDVVALISGDAPPSELNGMAIRPMGWHGGLCARMRHLPSVFLSALRQKADCYYFGNFELIPVALALKAVTGAKIAYDAMEHYPDMVRVSAQVPRHLRAILAWGVDVIERLTARAMDIMMTADEPTIERFVNHPHQDVIFNFPSIRVFDEYDEMLRKNLRERYGTRRIIAYVGSMGWDRGLREMAAAMTIVRHQHPDALLLLLGGWQFPEWREQFEALLNESDLASSIELLGAIPQKDLGAYLRIAEMGLAPLAANPKHEKNIATKQFDYMCCCIPVIANDLEPMRLFTGKASAGLVVDTSNAERFAEAILQLLHDSDAAKEMGARGRAAIANTWNWETESRKLQALFEKVLPPAPKRIS